MKIFRILKWIFYSIFTLLLVVNLVIFLTGKTYLYKGIYYNYVNIDDYKIFENRVVKAGHYQPWARANNYNTRQLSNAFLKELDSLQTTAFLIVKNDSLVHEEYWNGYTETKLSNSFSIAKTIVGLLIGIALDEGLIKSLDEPVSHYLKGFNSSMGARLTIRHLLMMSSGLNWDETYSSLFSITTESYYGSDLEKLLAGLEVVVEPGTIHNYKSCDTQLLAFILEKVTGKKLAEYASEKLWKKIGARSKALWSLDKQNGHEKAYCCFNSTAQDFARIGKLILDCGKWQGNQIVSSSFIKRCLSPNLLPDETGKPTDYYGYQTWLENYKDNKLFYMRGILGQWVIVIPEERIIIVRLGEGRGKPMGNAYEEFYDMVDVALQYTER